MVFHLYVDFFWYVDFYFQLVYSNPQIFTYLEAKQAVATLNISNTVFSTAQMPKNLGIPKHQDTIFVVTSCHQE